MFIEIVGICLALLVLSILREKIPHWRGILPPSPTPLPIIGHFHLLGPLIHHAFRDLSSRYGPLIYLKLGSVPCVVASTPDLAKELLKHNDLTFSARKHSFAVDQLTYSSSFAFAPYGPYWKFVKKVSTFEFLGNRVLNHFLPVRAKELRRFLDTMKASAQEGRSVNVTQELIKLSNNIISMMMFGFRSSETESQADVARALVREVTQLFGEFNVSDFIWLLKNVDVQGFKKKTEGLHQRYDDFLEEIICTRERERKEPGRPLEESNSFLDIMLEHMEDDNQEVELTRKHIKALILDFLTAATDTTAISVEWALAELVNHPRVFAKAREEIDAVVGLQRVVQEADFPNLPYLQAVVKETFRLHPPIPMIIRKSIQDCKVQGYVIPANTTLFVNMWSIARDPKYWEEPLEFKPERFLVSGDNIDVKGQHFQLLPFGTGRRSCPGVSLAMQEVPVTLAAMIQCFDWVVPNGSGGSEKEKGEKRFVDMSERPGLTAPRVMDLMLQPVCRSGHV